MCLPVENGRRRREILDSRKSAYVFQPPDSRQPTGRYRFLKRILRYLPRRATLHRYPIIGRFAASLRPRAYLWSIRRADVRRAYYAGSILAFLPLMGLQLPLALLAALVLRSNFMVLGGLQLITNPLTAGPIYFLTHELGAEVLNQFGTGEKVSHVTAEVELLALGGLAGESITEPLTSERDDVSWTMRARAAIAAMIVGGTIVGTLVGIVMDLLDRISRTSRSRQLPPVA